MKYRQIKELRRLWMAGASAYELAARFHVSPRFVWLRCEPALFGRKDTHRTEAAKRAGWRKSAPRRKATTARDHEIRRLWSEGSPGAAICRRFGLAKSTVSGIVKGMPGRRRHGDPWEISWPHPRRKFAGTGPPSRPAKAVPTVPAEALPARRAAPPSRSKLSDDQVAEMRRLASEGWSGYRLARQFHVSANTARSAIAGKTYSEAGRPPSTSPADDVA